MRVPRKAKKKLKKLGNCYFKTKTFGWIAYNGIYTFSLEHYAPFDGYITTKKARRWKR